ncbi:uncharacterized protein LOC115926838 [Strongylocentrotus purpuratus]|uniref:FAR1 domain-containing protein n=1 Tax=Strongylocentrotus purpuratus TaxID=7668 RepID=A0A7M7PEU2_STRPU|nr:uncharacterized protein LOC115926838 [Strongylocentrotus purpuratus]
MKVHASTMTLSLCAYCNANQDPGSLGDLESFLPSQFKHEVCSYETLGGESNFECMLRMKVNNQDEVQTWLEAFKSRTDSVTWRLARTYPDAGRFNSYRVDLRCQHNTRHTSKPGKRTKDTKCPATMSLVLKRSIKYSRSKNPHITAGLLFTVTLRFEHNHPLSCANAVRRKDVSEATVAKLKTLFENGHSPSSALDTMKHDLQEVHGDQYVFVSTDRSICPDLHFCYRQVIKAST